MKDLSPGGVNAVKRFAALIIIAILAIVAVKNGFPGTKSAAVVSTTTDTAASSAAYWKEKADNAPKRATPPCPYKTVTECFKFGLGYGFAKGLSGH